MNAPVEAPVATVVDVVPVKFHFKTKEDEVTKQKTRRPTVELKLPLVNLNGIIEIINSGDEKMITLMVDSLREVQVGQARNVVNEKEDITQDNFPLDTVDWKAIAYLPPAQRRGAGIPKEQFDEFAKDYISVMPAVTGKTEKQVANAAFFFQQKLNPLKAHPEKDKHLSKLKEQLALYAGNSARAEEFTDVIEFLNDKADALIKADSINDALQNM
jgi:hypothetical protein